MRNVVHEFVVRLLFVKRAPANMLNAGYFSTFCVSHKRGKVRHTQDTAGELDCRFVADNQPSSSLDDLAER